MKSVKSYVCTEISDEIFAICKREYVDRNPWNYIQRYIDVGVFDTVFRQVKSNILTVLWSDI